MDGEVDLSGEQSPLDLTDEGPSAEVGEGSVSDAITLGGDRHELKVVHRTGRRQAISHERRLNHRQLRPARSNTISHGLVLPDDPRHMSLVVIGILGHNAMTVHHIGGNGIGIISNPRDNREGTDPTISRDRFPRPP